MHSKSQLRRKAHRLIRKDHKGHQTAYDELKQLKSDSPKVDIAEIVSKVPSDAKNRKTQGLRIAFIICLGLVFIIRVLDLIANIGFISISNIIVFLFHGITLPALGIVGALTSRIRYYKLVAVFMTLSTLGTVFSAVQYESNLVLAFAIPFIGAAILGFVIPAKIKVLYQKKMVQRELKGRTVNVYEYFFNESKTTSTEDNNDLLDM
jgi:hypothetical protein